MPVMGEMQSARGPASNADVSNTHPQGGHGQGPCSGVISCLYPVLTLDTDIGFHEGRGDPALAFLLCQVPKALRQPVLAGLFCVLVGQQLNLHTRVAPLNAPD